MKAYYSNKRVTVQESQRTKQDVVLSGKSETYQTESNHHLVELGSNQMAATTKRKSNQTLRFDKEPTTVSHIATEIKFMA